MDYLPGGPPTTLELGPVAGRVTESLDHDWQYRRTGQTVTAPGPMTHLDLTYGYDPAGNLETVTDTTGARDASYTYDHRGRLTGVTWPDGNRTYTYDPIGNMTNLVADEGLAGQGELLLTYQPNGTGANTPTLTDMASTQGGSPLWSTAVASDDVGNMTTDGASTYTYDLRNHLDARALDTPSFDNTFSADGRLARTDRTDTTSSLDVILDTSGQRLAKLEDGVWRDYVFLGGRLVGYLDASATEPVLVITDHIGLPVQAIDPTGALVWDATAEPYGQLRGTLDTTHDPGLRYPGQWQDHIEVEANCIGPTCTFPDPLGHSFSLYENGYRWYRPDLGRYTQADPLTMGRRIENSYGYATGSPLTAWDVSGLQTANPPFYLPDTSMMDQPHSGPNGCWMYSHYFGSECCSGKGEVREDIYPKLAAPICREFMRIHQSVAATCVSFCLADFEQEVQKVESCDERNALRLERHVFCYGICSFVPTHPEDYPEDAFGVGLAHVWPGWRCHRLGICFR